MHPTWLFRCTFKPSGSHRGYCLIRYNVFSSNSQQEEWGQAEKWRKRMDTARREERQGEAMSTERTNNSYQHITSTRTHAHTLCTFIQATHMLRELAERKETDILSWGWKCLAKRRWAWKRFSLQEHICFSLLEFGPVLWAVTGWKLLHENVLQCM